LGAEPRNETAPGNGDLPWRAAVPLHRQGRFANAQSASRRSIPRWGKRKKGIRRAQSQTTGPAKRWLRGLAALIRPRRIPAKTGHRSRKRRRKPTMHDIRWIRENAAEFDKALNRRPLDAESRKQFSSANLLAIDERRRAAILKYEQAQARRNAASKEIGAAKAKKDEVAAQKLMAEVNELKVTLPALEAEAAAVVDGLDKVLASIPNLPLAEVPGGKDETGNVEHHKFGAKREYAFKPKEHFELGEALGLMDFETAAKLSGSRFVILKGGLARMERALGQLMLDVHTGEHGYTEVN